MTFRIAVGGISHETNTYVPSPTTLDHFTIARGDTLAQRAGARLAIGGMLDEATRTGAEIVPLVFAWANPWGVVDAGAYTTLKQELLDGLQAALPVDAVVLDLHGAGVTETTDDLEGDLTQAVRDLVGPDVALVVTHDLHGNITAAEAAACDAMFCCNHYPHDDLYERGIEAVQTALRIRDGDIRPVTHLERLPLLMPTTTTYSGVGAAVNDFLWQLEKREGVIDVTLQHGFPYSDVACTGASLIVITDGDEALARDVAREAGTFIWDRRDQLLVTHPQPAEAVQQALAIPGRPVVINETSDNAGGAAPADGTHLLRALLEAELDDAVFCGIKDAEVVRQATAAGVGATIQIELGGKTDDLHGKPIRATAYVKALTDGKIPLEADFGRGWVIDYGPTALLRIDGIDVVVISIGFQTIDRTLALAHGIDVMGRRIVALKSSNHFRSGFQNIAAGIVTTDPPGLTTYRIDVFPRSRTPRPIFPLDDDVRYP